MRRVKWVFELNDQLKFSCFLIEKWKKKWGLKIGEMGIIWDEISELGIKKRSEIVRKRSGRVLMRWRWVREGVKGR